MNSKQYFDDVAQQWDKMRKGFFSEAVREKAFEVAGLQKGKIAADIGAGTGFISEGLISEGLEVIAVDQSEKILAEMRQKFSNCGAIDYRVGDAAKLPIADLSVDYVFANMYLHHVESPFEAIKEMARILKPDGKLVLSDLDAHNHEFLKVEHQDRWLGFQREEIKRWFENAGLKRVVVDCVGENCCARSSRVNDSASISIFVASGTK